MRNLIRTALVITTLATPFAAFAGDAPATKPDVKAPAKDKATPPSTDKDKPAADAGKKAPATSTKPAPKKGTGAGSGSGSGK